MMKITWGTGIAIFYTVFVIVMLSLVIKSINIGVDLVEPDYYQKDLAYEEFRQKRVALNSSEVSIDIVKKIQEEELQIIFPKELANLTGNVTLFRPSDSKLDQRYSLKTNAENIMVISYSDLASGKWKLMAEFEAEGTAYYYEENLKL